MFNKLKKLMMERIEKDTVKSSMCWTDKKGNVIEETVIMKRDKAPLVGDWGRIYPPVNEDNSWNIINLLFGGKKNLIKLLIIGGLIGMILMGYYEIIKYAGAAKEGCMSIVIG